MPRHLALLGTLGCLVSLAGPALATASAPPAAAAHTGLAAAGAPLFDLRGRRVGTLPDAGAAPGARVVLPGAAIAESGAEPRELPAGVYFVGAPGPASPSLDPGASAFAFHDITDPFLPAALWNPSDVEARDVNGDGRADLVFSIHRESCDFISEYPFRVWIQQPDRTFLDETEARLPSFLALGGELELVDVERDGDTDVFLSGYSCSVHSVSAALYINDGTGHFSNQSLVRLPQYSDDRYVYFTAAGLLNDDLFVDLAVTLFSPNTFPGTGMVVTPQVWLNDGLGRFRADEAELPPPGKYGYLGVTAAELTGDGRDDILYANSFLVITDQTGEPVDTLSGQSALYRNLGGGSFADETVSRMPGGLERAQVWLPVADVDGDGDRDLLEVGFPFPENIPQLRLLVNDGTGRFETVTGRGFDAITGWFNRPRFGRLANWLGDDLFMPRVDPEGGGDAFDLIFLNNGAGVFGDFSSVLPAVSDFSVSCALFDYEADGDLDIATANSGSGNPALVGQNRLYRNRTVPVSVEDEAPGAGTGVRAIFPNPVASRMAVRFSLAREGEARLAIFDVSGRLVRELASRRMEPGEHAASWDLRDAAGRPVGAGIYSCRLDAAGALSARRFVVVR